MFRQSIVLTISTTDICVKKDSCAFSKTDITTGQPTLHKCKEPLKCITKQIWEFAWKYWVRYDEGTPKSCHTRWGVFGRGSSISLSCNHETKRKEKQRTMKTKRRTWDTPTLWPTSAISQSKSILTVCILVGNLRCICDLTLDIVTSRLIMSELVYGVVREEVCFIITVSAVKEK